MGRTVAIDYGTKRCGIAISDPLGMIANGLDTVESNQLVQTLKQLSLDPGFDCLVIGEAKRMGGETSAVETHITKAIKAIESILPDVKIERFDERFTSKLALDTMIRMGASKKQRKVKGNVDKISATLLLQEYLNSK